jgi:hypothetical protein
MVEQLFTVNGEAKGKEKEKERTIVHCEEAGTGRNR